MAVPDPQSMPVQGKSNMKPMADAMASQPTNHMGMQQMMAQTVKDSSK